MNEKRISLLKLQADIQQVKLSLSTAPTGLAEVFLRLRPTFSTKLDHVPKYIPPKLKVTYVLLSKTFKIQNQ